MKPLQLVSEKKGKKGLAAEAEPEQAVKPKKTKAEVPTQKSMGRDPSLDELLDNQQPIYVRNCSVPMGTIHVSFNESGTGRALSLVVPDRFAHPISVSDRIPLEAIDKSTDFRQHIGKRMLRLVWPADAEKELSDPQVQEDLRAVYASSHAGGTWMGAASRFSAEAVQQAAKEEQQSKKRAAEEADIRSDKSDDDDPQAKLNPRVLGLVSGLNADPPDITPSAAKREIRGMYNNLASQDLQYIITNVRGKHNSEVKDICRNLLAKKVESEDADEGE